MIARSRLVKQKCVADLYVNLLDFDLKCYMPTGLLEFSEKCGLIKS
jgi:hypothetical protein